MKQAILTETGNTDRKYVTGNTDRKYVTGNTDIKTGNT